ncbi:MAG: hypothetical protein HGB17_06445 [Syntrophobacteraceae bacterium]|nr:hypothetical protein [Syntrophobacteraceae bacterium]
MGKGGSILVATGGIALLAVFDITLLPWLFTRLATLGDAARIAVSMAVIAPLAFLMGMPFPLGLAMVGDSKPAHVPWAWGINGCASVLATVLASILAVHLGLNAVILLAVALYGLAAVVFREPSCRSPE